MIVQVVYLVVQANRLDDFLTEASANARASLLEAGVTRFDLLQQADDPLKFMLYEVYRNQTDLDAHRLTPHRYCAHRSTNLQRKLQALGRL